MARLLPHFLTLAIASLLNTHPNPLTPVIRDTNRPALSGQRVLRVSRVSRGPRRGCVANRTSWGGSTLGLHNYRPAAESLSELSGVGRPQRPPARRARARRMTVE